MLHLVYRSSLVGLLLGLNSLVMAATPPIGAKLLTALPSTLGVNQVGRTVYQITNNFPYAVSVTYTPLATNGVLHRDNSIHDNCPAGPLAPGQSCNWAARFTVGNQVGLAEATLQLRYGGNTVNADQKVIVKLLPGYFVFRQQGMDIGQLNLAPGANGNLTLHNIGDFAITNFNLAFNNSTVASYFGGSCTLPTTTEIAPSSDCTLTYTIPTSAQATSFTIKATGSGADNSPQVLNGNIALQGDIEVTSDMTASQTFPSVKRVKVENVGGQSITDLSISKTDSQNAFTIYDLRWDEWGNSGRSLVYTDDVYRPLW